MDHLYGTPAVIGLSPGFSLLAHVVAAACSMRSAELLLTPARGLQPVIQTRGDPEKTLSRHLEAKLQIQ